MKKIMVSALLGCALVFGMVSNMCAKEGFYLGAGLAYNSISGDFDGKSGLRSGDVALILPEIDPAVGYGIFAGFGFTPQFALELNYLASTHDGTWMGISTGDVEYSVFNIDLKFNFLPDEPTQPYFLVGLCSNTITVKDGAFDLSTGANGDAKFTGRGYNLGAGVDHDFNPNFSTTAGLTYRIVEYNQGEGLNVSGDISDPLKTKELSVTLRANYHF